MVTGTFEALGGGEALVKSPAAATGVGAIVPQWGLVSPYMEGGLPPPRSLIF